MCRTTPDGGSAATGWEFAQSQAQLEAAGKRNVVNDASTNLTGASFGPDGSFFGLDLREANFTNTTWTDANFACSSLDGARFEGASMTRQRFFHMGAHDADFDNLPMFTSWFCDVDWTGTTFRTSTWEGFSGLSCAEFAPENELDALPDPLVILDDADFSNSVMGGVPDPDRGQALMAFTYAFDNRTRKASMVGTNLDGVTIADGLFWLADLTGSTADGATFIYNQYTGFQNATFPATGWENATFTGSPNFEGVTCPDQTTGGIGNPCFAVTP